MRKRIFRVHEIWRNGSHSEAFQAVPNRSETVPSDESVRKWYEKQDENGKVERWQSEKVIVFGVLLAISILTAYKACDATGISTSVLLLVAYSMAADPMHLTRRKLSRNSRFILAAALLPLFVILASPSPRTVIVAATIAGIAGIIAIKGNSHWRAAESYKMSRHVLKALQPDDNTDHRDACLTAWQADGAREVVAAAAEMGAYACAPIEWEARKAAFTIGFCRASTITRIHERERATALMEASTFKRENEDLKAQLEAVQDMAENLEEYREKMKAADRAAVEAARAINENMKAQEEIRKLKRKIADLEEANETLVKTADNPLLAAEAAEHLKEQRLKEAAEKGFSVSQAEAYANVSHRRAYEYLRAYWDKHGKPEKTKPEKKPARDAKKGAA